MVQILRQPAEIQFESELLALKAKDEEEGTPTHPNWLLSPRSVLTYIMGSGGREIHGVPITQKYYGSQKLVEVSISTLRTSRALLLIGVPGTGKSWLSEHLAAAISGNSTLIVQGTAGTPEESIRFGWNYARLLSEGPTSGAVVPSPIMLAMERGKIARVEELTRIPADVQDALITVLSEKMLPIPELESQIPAVEGFNVIATANTRDKGVNDLSSALKRRFNTVHLPLPDSFSEETKIVQNRVGISYMADGKSKVAAKKEIDRIVRILREMRDSEKIKATSTSLSTAEAISAAQQAIALAEDFGNGIVGARETAKSLPGVIVKDVQKDGSIWKGYVETVLRHQEENRDLYEALKDD